MDISLDEFLLQEKQRVKQELQRLSARSNKLKTITKLDQENSNDLVNNSQQNSNFNKENLTNQQILYNLNSENVKTNLAVVKQVNDRDIDIAISNPKSSSLLENSKEALNLKISAHNLAEMVNEKTYILENNCNSRSSSSLKKTLDYNDNNKVLYENPMKYVADYSKNVNNNNDDKEKVQKMFKIGHTKQKHKQDDMEQWVTDTFYSYFPGFNNENQKRQHFLQDRQRENQENFLKHQQLSAAIQKQKKAKNNAMKSDTLNATQPKPITSNATHSTIDKTELEIIVNNPNYVSKHSNNALNNNSLLNNTNAIRPGSSRQRLLQDLRHTELSQMVGGDAVTERNQRNAELETARKKVYQHELMQQIEEKRRSIEILREKERHQEEIMTRRLQEQMKTIQLEEQLEKERLLADRLRFDAEQNRLLRLHLLAKLENDEKLLQASRQKKKHAQNKETHKDSMAGQENRVYKYFSNSAKHEYKRGEPLSEEVEWDLEIPDNTKLIERECFHISDKICPTCNIPLKNYESCCLRCQNQMTIKIKHKENLTIHENHDKVEKNAINNESTEKMAEKSNENNAQNDNDDENDVIINSATKTTATKKDNNDIVKIPTAEGDYCIGTCHPHSYSLVCVKCERLYLLCTTCLKKSDVCRACHQQRNVCMNCRRTLCSFCLEEVACGRDTERQHINERLDKIERLDQTSENSFQILELNYAALQPNSSVNSPYNTSLSSQTTPQTSPTYKKPLQNNLKRPPYSINIERNSIFHPDYTNNSNLKSMNSFEKLPIINKSPPYEYDSDIDENLRLDRMRRDADQRLSRYFKNYGDLTNRNLRSKSESTNRSTQTTPNTTARRDIVLNEEYNLSMPLLREMPKMTRKDTKNLLQIKTSKMDDINRKWEIPAVQKLTISPNSPRIITQVGAIRKQLQAERLLFEDADDENDEFI